MASPPSSLTTILATLAASEIEFVLVGGLAAVAQGAPLTTFDADIVHARTRENVDKLLAVLHSMHARYRGRKPPLPPDRDALLGTGHNLFITDLGPLDVLGAIEGGRDFADLETESITISVEGHAVKVVRLETLAELKRGATNAKDRVTLAILEECLRRRG